MAEEVRVGIGLEWVRREEGLGLCPARRLLIVVVPVAEADHLSSGAGQLGVLEEEHGWPQEVVEVVRDGH